ncbi:Glutathione transport system permease protein gsiC [Raoultella planticola]|uniref:Glutathione transport system permease protein gsiC n=1 Tax=Raoultella planticola TaxID=575 RepID=A0A485AVL6_RAOPL|nr:Glutathione transport system permease protein gsiC [Raoultella planticola]
MVRQQLGLDQPLHVQFWHYITSVLQGDFGTSMGVAPSGQQRNSQPLYADVVADPRQHELGGDLRHGGGHCGGRVAQSLA